MSLSGDPSNNCNYPQLVSEDDWRTKKIMMIIRMMINDDDDYDVDGHG